MIGNTLWPAWWWWSTTTEPVRVMIPTITAKLAWPATSAGSTPGRRTISRSGAGGAVRRRVVLAAAVCSSSPIRFGSGRTNSTSTSATAMKPTEDHHSSASESPSSSRSASSGLNTSGPRIAPNTAPKSTSAMPRARRSGGYMSPAAVRASSAVPLAAPTHDEPGEHDGRRLELRAQAGQRAAEPARREPGREHRHAAEAVHRAARGQRRERARGEHDRRAEAEQLVDADARARASATPPPPRAAASPSSRPATPTAAACCGGPAARSSHRRYAVATTTATGSRQTRWKVWSTAATSHVSGASLCLTRESQARRKRPSSMKTCGSVIASAVATASSAPTSQASQIRAGTYAAV